MPATVDQARDQMLTLLNTAVGVSDQSSLVLIWEGLKNQPLPPEPPTPWARVSVRHTTGRQTALTGAFGVLGGKQKFTRGGFILVQTFVKAGDGGSVSDDIVRIILGAFEGKTTSGGVFFKNARFTEIGDSGPWTQTNVTIDFEYDDLK